MLIDFLQHLVKQQLIRQIEQQLNKVNIKADNMIPTYVPNPSSALSFRSTMLSYKF